MEQLQRSLRNLRLGGMAEMLPIRFHEARAQEIDYDEFIRRLLDGGPRRLGFLKSKP